jgi:hypothetical protein
MLQKKRIYYPLLVICAAIYSCLNYYNLIMSGIWRYYDDFAGFIKSGFSASYVFRNGNPTFPMWGYGFVFAVTHNKALIIFLQQCLGLVVIVQWLLYLERKWSRRKSTILKILLLCSFPLFFYNTTIAPYSIGSGTLLMGVLLTIKYLERKKVTDLFLAAICFGIMLNFRSDYYYFIFLLLATAALFQWRLANRIFFWHYAACAAVVLMIMLPWMQYTHSKTGKYLLTSTNSGHVLYIGLGQLPNNPWGIEKGDNSPQMLQLVRERLGDSGTLVYPADTLLRHQWLKSIRQYPIAFVKKMAYNVYTIYRQPFYIGDIYAKHEVARHDLKHAVAIALNMLCRVFFMAITVLFIRFLVLGRFIRSLSDPVFLFSVLLIIYQIFLQSIGYALFLYNTGIYFVYLLMFVYLLPVAEGEK